MRHGASPSKVPVRARGSPLNPLAIYHFKKGINLLNVFTYDLKYSSHQHQKRVMP